MGNNQQCCRPFNDSLTELPCCTNLPNNSKQQNGDLEPEQGDISIHDRYFGDEAINDNIKEYE